MTKRKRVMIISLVALLMLITTTIVWAQLDDVQREDGQTGTLYRTVREATAVYQSVSEAKAAGYGLFHGCVSGPEEGAMGVHFVNGNLVGDGMLDAAQPEALIYEPRNGQMRLVGVEYVVFADAWHANNDGQPMLMGQLFNYVGSPNRYGLPAFYELHVWAWKQNPKGVFADWNPTVSCRDFVPEVSH
jgi:hypothetical protein